MAVPFTVTDMADDERTECIVCMADFMEQTDPTAHIWQCADGHTLCSACFSAVGGAVAPCPVCNEPIGSIRNRALEKLRNAHLARLRNRAAVDDPLSRTGSTGSDCGAQAAASRPDKIDSWNFKFNPAKVNPLAGGSSKSNTSNLTSGMSESEPAAVETAASGVGVSASQGVAKPSAKFTFVSPSTFSFGDGAAAAGCGLSAGDAAPATGRAQPNELFGDSQAEAEANPEATDPDGASSASTQPTETSPASKISSTAQSLSPPAFTGGTSGEQSSDQQSPSMSQRSGTKSSSSSPMELDASASKAGGVRRSKPIFSHASTLRDKTKRGPKKHIGAKETAANSNGFVFEVSEMLKRTVLEPNTAELVDKGEETRYTDGAGFPFRAPLKSGPAGPSHQAGQAESLHRAEACGAQGMGADTTEQPQGPVNQPSSDSARANTNASSLNTAFHGPQTPSESPPPPCSRGVRSVQRSASKSGERKSRGSRVAAAAAAFEAPLFSFTAPTSFVNSAAAAAEAAPPGTGFSFDPPRFTFAQSAPAPGTSAPETVGGLPPFTFASPTRAAEEPEKPVPPEHAQPGFGASVASNHGGGCFQFAAPKPSGGAADAHVHAGAAASTASDIPTFNGASHGAASPATSHGPMRRSARCAAASAKKGPKSAHKTASPLRAEAHFRPEEVEDVGGGGFSFRTPMQLHVPADFKWEGKEERDAFEKLARIAGASAAARLLEKNPNLPPSQLLARVTIGEPHGQQSKQERRRRGGCDEAPARRACAGDAAATASGGGVDAKSVQAVTEHCIQLKDRGNSYFRQHKWEAATETYAQGAQLASAQLPGDYNAANADADADSQVLALAHVASVLYSNGANALEKLGRHAEALECCRRALRLNADNGKAALRGAQCAVGMGLFQESVPLYRAALARGFPNLEAELAKAEQMRDDVRKAADLLEQDNGARAKVCLSDARAAAPRAPAVLHLLVKAHLQCKEFDKARSVCKQLLSALQRSRSASPCLSHASIAVLHARALCGLGIIDGECRSKLPIAVIPQGYVSNFTHKHTHTHTRTHAHKFGCKRACSCIVAFHLGGVLEICTHARASQVSR